MKFAANLTMMFNEAGSLLKRYEAAAVAGFKYVECAFPYAENATEIAELKTKLGLNQVLINAPPGDFAAGDRGLACLPHRRQEFKDSIHSAIQYAKALQCPRVHVMAGIPPSDVLRVTVEEVYAENIRYAADEFAKEGITCLIEPINRFSMPDYFLFNYDQALGLLQKLKCPNLKIMLDIFHAQQICGSLTDTITRILPFTGHMQIAQVPARHEPDSAGEIDYDYIFKLLQKLEYDGFIGCEYIPESDTTTGLIWTQKLGVSLN